MSAAPRAAVDVGTNSVRLLVVDGHGVRITREMAITRLGAGVDRTGHLDDQALARTLSTIAGYHEQWEHHGVDAGRVRIAATSAVRDASDRDRFFDGVREATGVEAEVLTGEVEAEAAFAGATGAVEVAAPAAVVDVGGGSTELIVGDVSNEVRASVSLQLGCVRLRERHLPSDPPTADELLAARELVSAQLDEVDEVLGRQGASLHGAAAVIGVAGTATTLAGLHLGLAAYDEDRIHATHVPVHALRELAVELSSLPASSRAALGPVQPGREDVIHAGALILAGIVERYGFAELVVSEADVLDGLVASIGS